MKLNSLVFVCAAWLFAHTAQAQGFWLPTGDQRLRDDVTLLVDEGVLLLPTTTWPIPAADVREAVERVNGGDIGNAALEGALQRVRGRVAVPVDAEDWLAREVTVTAGRPGLLRDYGTLGRDNGEVRSVGGTTNDRWSATIAATGVVNPDDGKRLRFDGSDVTVRWGNWLFSANTLERWWGPGQGGSLILSNNARPMPQLSLDRMSSRRSSVPVLSWIGPWRFSAVLGALEGHRPDVNHPLFMGMRLTVQPLPIVELGVSRSAQFCGQNAARTRPPCDAATIGRMVLGKDNVGWRGVSQQNEPGNQLAGFDARITSPFRILPAAIYAQLIAEDNGVGIIPNRFLGLFGGEAWAYLESGAVLRAQLEYAGTSCKFYAASTQPDCAYQHGIFRAGYRYRGRAIGHTTDSDSETWALRLTFTQSSGDSLALKLRHGRLDKYGTVDRYNGLTQGPSDLDSAELNWQGAALGQDLGLQLGYARGDASGALHTEGTYGFVSWRKAF